MQTSMIVRDTGSGTKYLDERLKDGWKVIHTCPMPSSVSVSVAGDGYSSRDKEFSPTCLVILEKD